LIGDAAPSSGIGQLERGRNFRRIVSALAVLTSIPGSGLSRGSDPDVVQVG